jgi:hypothetical protein
VSLSCLQESFTNPQCSGTTAPCGFNHATVVTPFLNMAYKSADVNALSALEKSPVDTSRFSSRNPSTRGRRPSLLRKSRYRVHGEKRRSMMSGQKSVLELVELSAAVRFRMLYASTRHLKRSENEIKCTLNQDWISITVAAGTCFQACWHPQPA